MEPDDLTIDPGSQITTKVTVRNIGTRVEEFELVVQGPGAEFATVTPATVSVYPDVEQRAVVRFAPLRGPQSPAGVSTFEVVARSVVHSDVRDVTRGRLTVTAFEDLQAVLKPDASRGRKPGRHVVSVTNGGNTPVSSQVALADQDKVLTFEPQNTAVTLQPGGTAEVPVLLNGPRRWFGRTERLPFAAVVTPAGTQPPITLNGTRQQTAVFPWWMPPAALVILAMAIGLAALIKSLVGPPTVPTIGNVDQVAAVKKLEESNYIPQVVHQTDKDVDTGLVIGTDPKGGAPLKHGQIVKLLISQGKCVGPCPVLVEVPNVVGLQQDTATAQLQQMGFGVRTQQKTGDDPAGQVTDEDPKAATPSPTNTQVLLSVSSGPKASPGNAAGGAAPGGAAPGGAAPGGAAPGGAAPGGAAPGGAAAGGAAAGGAAAGGAAGAAAGGAAGGGPAGGGGAGTTSPKQIEIPALKSSSVEDASKALEKLGLKVKSAPEHSNALPDGQVLSSKPEAAAKVDPGSEVTLTVAKNTAVDLIAAAGKATWTDQAKTNLQVTDTATATGVARTTKDGSPVLVITPGAGGSITGVYTLKQPIISGDHLRARIGQLTDADKFTFVVKADGNPIQKVIKTVKVIDNIPFQEIDADLSPAKDATKIEITVTDASTTAQEWHEFRLASPTG